MHDYLFRPLGGWNTYEQLLAAAQASGVALAYNLSEGHKPHLTAALSRDTGRPLVLVAASEPLAARLVDDLTQLMGPVVGLLPAREVAFYHTVAASHEMTARRLETLMRARQSQLKVVVVPADALMHRLLPPGVFDANVIALAEGQQVDREVLSRRLVKAGYQREEMVEGKGQFAVRGGILDVFSPDALTAVRVEFFDDEVDSIRAFDVLTQRSQTRQKAVTLAPAAEALLADDQARAAADRLEEALVKTLGMPLETLEPNLLPELPPLPEDEEELPGLWEMQAPAESKAAKAPVSAPMPSVIAPKDRLANQMRTLIAALREGQAPRGLERWMHLIYPQTVTVLDYLEAPLVILDEPDRLRDRCENRLLEFAEAFKSALTRGEALAAQGELLLSYDDLQPRLTGDHAVAFAGLLRTMGGIRPKAVLDFAGTPGGGYQGQFKELAQDIARWREKGMGVVLMAGGVARGQRLAASLLELNVLAPFVEDHPGALKPGEVIITPLKLTHGFHYPQIGLAVVSDTEIFGVAQQKARARKRSGEKIAAFTDLKVGDYVVHESHGVGIYQGTIRLQSEGTYRDYLLIQYQGADKLYVPTDQLDRVQKYIGSDKAPPRINRLGGNEWQKQKAKVKQSIRALAIDLVKLYAQRQAMKGFAFSPDTPWQRQFEDNFAYEETVDQLQSIEEIKADMQKVTCMDRLLCGDVGYGKTEVALRAAFKAVMDGKQVAILAPTTILAQQHLNTIARRFEGFPATFEVISRFKTAAEQKKILAALKGGQIDILVGTHRLLGKDVVFKDLGLLVVDEEQRFGVAHKEGIKNLKASIDVLTLSATPIPRTLHMSMVGIRDMSVLETPPDERYPVQTYVVEYQDGLIRDAILREIGRQGQVYFLYNRVASIEQFHKRLSQLVPEARIAVGHGQMREHALEDVMLDFYDGKYDVLLCTTIIESGLDVPSANTMIVYDADRFGLAQLYQLRGRVGRSNRLAYAYLTVRPSKMLTEDAQKRLDAIREFTEFGSGFRIAMRDLELRGAGNILGPEQSGQLSAVGYDMYVKLIEEAVREARGEQGEVVDVECRVELAVDAYLPQDYVRGEYLRVEMYKRIAAITDMDSRDDVEEELVDRFGDTPTPVVNLVAIAHLKALCEKLQVESVMHRGPQLVMKFAPTANLDGMKLLSILKATDARLMLTMGKATSIMLRDARLEGPDMLHEAVKLMDKVVGRMEKEGALGKEEAPEPQTAME